MAKRLTKDDWLTAGLAALTSDGARALAAEPMSRRLRTTKGSFYWHFKDVPAYHAEVIENWRRAALAALGDEVSSMDTPDKRLRRFGRAILSDASETSVRAWAQSNPDLTETLRAVDAERLTYLNLLLRELGLANPDFARALQAALIGLPQLAGEDRAAQRRTYDTLVDTVLALQN